MDFSSKIKMLEKAAAFALKKKEEGRAKQLRLTMLRLLRAK
jgi:hypothetical protein